MVTTRKSLGTPGNSIPSLQKRPSLEGSSLSFPKLYPDITEQPSYASTAVTRTSEIADDDEDYATDADTSYESSRASEAPEIGEKEYWKYGLAAAAVLVLAILIGAVVAGRNKQSDSQYEKYIKSVRSVILSQFPDISKENRDILRLIGQKVYLEPGNTAPLVILVGGTQARRFSEAVSGIIRSTKIDDSDEKSDEYLGKLETIRVESDTNRAELHEILNDALSGTSAANPKTAVILDVDLLKWDAVLVVHAFADHEKYPVPKTVLFLTVSTENRLENENESDDAGNCDERMVRFLTNRWIENGGSSDNIPPIIARISYFICV